MSESTGAMQRIAFVTDLEDHSREAFSQAVGVALHTQSVLYVLHVGDPERASRGWRRLPTVRTLLERWGRLSQGGEVPEYHSLHMQVHQVERGLDGGALADRVDEELAALEPDLVLMAPTAVVGSWVRPPSQARANRLRRPALYLPVGSRPLVSAATGAWRVRRVVVPVKRSTDTRGIVAAIDELGGEFAPAGVMLVLVHVGTWSTVPTGRLPTRAGWSFRLEVRAGSVVRQVTEAVAAHDADLLVLGTSGARSFRSHLLGSVTDRLVSRSSRPVLVLPVDLDAPPAPGPHVPVPRRTPSPIEPAWL
jgi:nucleotide-binding universal stress UspA family protein